MNDRGQSDRKEQRNKYIRYLGAASTVGIHFVTSTFVGFAIGHGVIDSIFNTRPWFTIICMLLGIAAGFMHLFKIAKRAGEFDTDEPREKRKDVRREREL
jgi:F0F1-type ATP synthase assembly protein I